MQRYSEQHCQAVLQKWLNSGLSMRAFSKQQGINLSTLYSWKKKFLPQHQVEQKLSKNTSNSHWTSEQKFSAVLETATLTETQLSEYCRNKGIYPEDVKEWKETCLNANQTAAQNRKQQAQERKSDQKRIKQLEKELKRKDAALAETAALLVLRKKLNAYWGVNAED